MNHTNSILQIASFLFFPWFAIHLATKNKFFRIISPVVLCYLFGFLLGLQPWMPLNAQTTKTFLEASIALSLPLLLFRSDFISWLKVAGKTLGTYLAFCFFVVVSSVVSYFIVSPYITDASLQAEFWKAVGMIIGVFVGGSVNLNAIGVSLNTKTELLTMLNTSEIILGAVFLLFLMTVAQKLFLRFLPSYQEPSQNLTQEEEKITRSPSTQNPWIATIVALCWSILCLGCVVIFTLGFTQLFFGKASLKEEVLLLALTTGGILFSMIPKVRQTPKSYETGEYLLFGFCIAIGCMTDLKTVFQNGISIFLFVLLVLVLAVLLQLLFAKLWKIDVDTVIITITAGVYGPPFIGPVATSLKNKNLLLSGLITSSLGLGIANFIGLGVAKLLQLWIR